MTESAKVGITGKSRFLIVLLAATFIFMTNGFSEEMPQPQQQQEQQQQQGEEIKALKDKLGKLEKTINDQTALIEQQKQMLDKIIESIPQAKAAVTPPEPKTMVKKFVIDGANLFTAKEFEPILTKYRDKELSMTDLKKIADEITAFYRKNGYLTSMAYVPPQEIADNTVEFKVVEGRVGDVEVEQPKHGKASRIQKRFMVEKGHIFNSNQVEANLHRVNRLPDRTMRAILLPSATPETSNVVLKVDKEKSPQHFYAEYNNRGTSVTTKNRFALGYINNNLLGNDDVLRLNGVTNIKTLTDRKQEVYSFSAAYDFPITRYDTRLGVYGAFSQADIGGQFVILTPEGKAQVYGVYASQPWLDKRFFDEASNSGLALTGNLTGGFDSISVRNKILGNETSHDELRVFKVGANFEETDNLGRGGLTGEFQIGIPDFLGSMGKYDQSASRIDAGGKFQKYILSLNRVNRLPASTLIMDSFKCQLTNYPLVNSEQMVIGGVDSVRGFPEANYLADYGWVNNLEFRTPAFFLPTIIKVPFDKKHTALYDAIQLVAFLDAGSGSLNKARVGETKQQYLIGTGFGFRINMYEHLIGRLDIGYPISSDKPIDNSNNTIHFGVEYEW
ncbi:MAG: hypothetical protein NTV07_03435 [Candidatus Omnitrophica bacterium]|nr:hypothetical protein [Candidatus Omnitrophota bacterium]